MPIDTNELKYTFEVTANRCKKVESSSIIDRDEVEQEIEFDFNLNLHFLLQYVIFRLGVKNMKVDFGKQTYLYPMPVLIIATYDENGNADIMNAKLFLMMIKQDVLWPIL